MTLSAFAWNIARTYTLTPGRRYSFSCRYRLGTASNLVMYERHRHLPWHGVAGRLGLLGAAGRSRQAALRSLRRVHPRGWWQSGARWASAFEGESVLVTDLLADLLALTGSATLDGLTAQGNVGCDQLLTT